MVNIPNCPICGGEGVLAYVNCKDQFMDVAGTWNYNRCKNCSTLWMNPQVAEDEIPSLYAKYYTHLEPKSALNVPNEIFLGKSRLIANLDSLRRQWGYGKISQEANQNLVTWIGRLISRLPGSKMRAGAIVRYVKKHENGKLLDVGCGNGSFMLTMQDLGWNVEGLEPDVNAVNIARRKGLDVTVGIAQQNQLPAMKWDAITMNHVIEHSTDPMSVIQLLAQKLNEGGTLVSISPNPVGCLAYLYGKNWFNLDSPRHLVIPSPKAYRIMTQVLGLDAEIFTVNNSAEGAFKFSLDYTLHNEIKTTNNWWFARLYKYFCAPIAKLFASGCGEEVVCIIKK